jgi:amidophosphoribosyltransferase
MGKKVKDGVVQSYAFSSETIAIESMVDSFEWVQPGEGIFIDPNLTMTRQMITQKKRQHCIFEWVYFSRATSVIEGMSVNHVRGNLGKKLAEMYLESPLYERLSKNHHKIIVAPIPETARPASVVFARHVSHEHKDVIEKNRFIGRIFIKPNETLREHEIASNVKAIEEVIKDKIVFLVDDSIVRGTTSRGIVQKIKSKGAKEVHFFSTCPPLINPCHYGVDLPTRKELIAYGKQLKEIEEYIGADSITYMSIDKLVDAIGIPKKDLCLACLNGHYPTDLTPKEVKL